MQMSAIDFNTFLRLKEHRILKYITLIKFLNFLMNK